MAGGGGVSSPQKDFPDVLLLAFRKTVWRCCLEPKAGIGPGFRWASNGLDSQGIRESL